ncbi:TIGR02996 domain-containing protein [Tuwongella immobilis]|uniref:Repeat-companion domain protein n=1 Tax=Tuwongella immobilis TaxID=692036 RepID=A0A6C2YNZ0_9BACT|nr:TIGR02996 domain-containing protein [Tuwongella immobilis]VIP03011.1 Leucine-rich repeat-containing protein typical subtype OS=Herpetosiphon aurantiacus (strain ATCC 23779 / DSM 785) GN=Haur_4051 PE=4 SV=1: LRR_6: LRR_6: LRR_6: LRR_6 [Tuwongella immobilis]VTS03120.1 Leucine-rich repeat-containing protein typical subtype OS=Herpetosiphon aurantiacus (strain ATCC 23779 / DSM 785) GN=Haur_4051 PE=4 SV=1: LRR_6: LRR_6: LRR_6: LRR_6 [Tuwongella immobilis]
MNSHENVYAQIRENPADDDLRWIFADWLVDHGNSPDADARAEFIRVQMGLHTIRWNADCERELRAEELRLLNQFGEAWFRRAVRDAIPESQQAAFTKAILGYRFHRGLIDCVTVTVPDFLRYRHELFRAFPLTQLRFRLGTSDREQLKALFICEQLRQIQSLEFEPARYSEPGLGHSGLRILLESEQLTQLKHLHFEKQNLTNRCMEDLIAWPGLAELHSLEVSHHRETTEEHPGLDGEAIAALIRSGRLRNLRMLKLDQTALGSAGIDAFGLPNCLDSLTVLSLERCKLGSHGAQILAASAGLPSLTQLDLRGNQIGIRGAQALAASSTLHQLRRIDLSSNRLTDAGLVAISQSPHVTQLRSLLLRKNYLGDAAATALAHTESPLSHLHTLDLRQNDVGFAGAEVIAQRRLAQLPKLSMLDLRENPIPPQDRHRLRASLGRKVARL